jgi:hypothetical protein
MNKNVFFSSSQCLGTIFPVPKKRHSWSFHHFLVLPNALFFGDCIPFFLYVNGHLTSARRVLSNFIGTSQFCWSYYLPQVIIDMVSPCNYTNGHMNLICAASICRSSASPKVQHALPYSNATLLITLPSALLCHRRLVAGSSPWRPGVSPKAVYMWFVVDKVAVGQFSSEVFGYPLSISFHSCYVFTCVSSEGWTMLLLAATVPQRHSPTRRNTLWNLSTMYVLPYVFHKIPKYSICSAVIY